MSVASPWLPFIYLYGVGGIIFLIPIVIGLRAGVIRLHRRLDRRLLFSMVFAYFFYFTLQGAWTIAALKY